MVAILTGPPLAEPVGRDEAKAFARIDGSAEDGTVDALLTAARQEVENRTGRALLKQEWRLLLDAVPPCGVVQLRPGPVLSVDAVTVYDAAGVPTLVDLDEYAVDTASNPGRVRLSGSVTPGRALNGLEIDFSAGHDPLPGPLRQAVLMVFAFWFEERDAGSVGALNADADRALSALLAPYRLPRFGP